ncbi:drug/metabolite transporter (DMT)-like permease [Propionicimonas paludicola]|uniref:Drug/metabolite transporter (DMT)-like permease n=1 Tax=Propionicimonas paludicola TaxID=185243 RepID=A0A2A9CQ33_9ACTN|nr:DMT family transporter [Propionicimonas paludicola]PFG15770.1 drug/metabolite transporter (DMT)-like permease [Propionicimonas paludicola]
MSDRLSALLALIASTMLFAASYTLTKVALVDLPPFTLGLARFVLAGAILALWAVVTRQPRPSRADRRRLLAAGLLGVTAYFAVENVALQWANATDAALLVASYPALTALADAAVNRRRTSAVAWLGIALAGLGVSVIVVAVPDASAMTPMRLWGDLLLLVPGVLWAFYTFITTEVTTSPLLTITWQDAIGGLAFVPLALLELPRWHWPTQPSSTLAALAGLTLLCSIAAMVTYARALRGLSSTTVVTGLNLVPLWGLVIAASFLHEQVHLLQLAGGLIVCLGVTLTALKPAGVVVGA